MIISMCIFCYSSLYSGTNELNFPLPGTEFTIHKLELNPTDFNPNSGGQGINWIMTDTAIGEVYKVKVLSPSSTTYSNYFKKADLIIENDFYSNSEFTACQKHYYFYNTSNGRMSKIGRLDIDTVLNQNYLTSFSHPEVIIEESIYYNKNLTDLWEGSYLNHGTNLQTVWKDGITEYNVDGTGELRIDGKIIPNIYRIQRNRSYTEEIDFDSSVSHSVTSFEWWSTEIPFPLINMELRSASNAPDKYYMYYLDRSHYIHVGQLESDAPEIGFELFPNPTTGSFSLSLNLEADTDIHVEILDASGRIVSQLEDARINTGDHTLYYDFKGKPGIYFIRAIADGTQNIKKLIII